MGQRRVLLWPPLPFHCDTQFCLELGSPRPTHLWMNNQHAHSLARSHIVVRALTLAPPSAGENLPEPNIFAPEPGLTFASVNTVSVGALACVHTCLHPYRHVRWALDVCPCRRPSPLDGSHIAFTYRLCSLFSSGEPPLSSSRARKRATRSASRRRASATLLAATSWASWAMATR